jgi:hypothetical protein
LGRAALYWRIARRTVLLFALGILAAKWLFLLYLYRRRLFLRV